MKRRDFLKTSAIGLTGIGLYQLGTSGDVLARTPKPAGVGMFDWTLGFAANPEAIPKARKANLDGIQVSVGTNPDNIPL